MKFASLPLVALALICSTGAQAQAVTSAVAPRGVAEEVERGRQLYMANGCFSCHGTVGQGGERSAGPKIAPEPYPFEAFRVFVRTPRDAMPRMDAKHISDDQLRDIHGYLASDTACAAAVTSSAAVQGRQASWRSHPLRFRDHPIEEEHA